MHLSIALNRLLSVITHIRVNANRNGTTTEITVVSEVEQEVIIGK